MERLERARDDDGATEFLVEFTQQRGGGGFAWFDLAAGKVKDITEIKELKKKVARMKTFIHEHATNAK